MPVAIPKEYTATAVTKEQLSPKIFFVQLKADTPFPFTPGQYGSWLIREHRRPLSFASLPSEEMLDFVIDVSPNGVCSQYTKALEIGQSVRLLAPYGRFTVPEGIDRPLLFIATGSGIAPIRAQIKQVLSQTSPAHPIHLFFGNRDENYLFMADEFTQLAQQHPNFHFTPVLSEPSENWTGAKGLVTQVIPTTIKDLPTWSAFICGNPQMVLDMSAVLEQHGIPPEHIHTERF